MPSLPAPKREPNGTSYLHVDHIPVEEKTAWVKTAAKAGKKLGDWVRQVLNEAAKKNGHS